MSERVWLIFDGRAVYQSTDDCQVHSSCNSEAEARREAKSHGPCSIYVYDMVNGQAVNERLVAHMMSDEDMAWLKARGRAMGMGRQMTKPKRERASKR